MLAAFCLARLPILEARCSPPPGTKVQTQQRAPGFFLPSRSRTERPKTERSLESDLAGNVLASLGSSLRSHNHRSILVQYGVLSPLETTVPFGSSEPISRSPDLKCSIFLSLEKKPASSNSVGLLWQPVRPAWSFSPLPEISLALQLAHWDFVWFPSLVPSSAKQRATYSIN